MGRRTKQRFAVVFLMTLTVILSLGLPSEDVLDAVYDESEAVPYERTPVFSIGVSRTSARRANTEFDCGPLLRLNSSTNRSVCRHKKSIESRAVPDALTIINHSLRC